jgi:hypothetical protein
MGGKEGQPKMASKGANKDIVHLWETQELEKRHV